MRGFVAAGKWDMRVIAVVWLVACSGDPVRHPIREWLDATAPGADGDRGICDPSSQIGCPAGEKCSWVTDALAPMPLGHIDCVMDGTAAIGAACTQGPAGSTTGFDNCLGGGYCWNATCVRICDLIAPTTCNTTQTCTMHPGTFLVNGTITYGTCE